MDSVCCCLVRIAAGPKGCVLHRGGRQSRGGGREDQGKVTITDAIAGFEEVTPLDPGVFWDWVELGRLYQSAGLSFRRFSSRSVRGWQVWDRAY